MQKKSDKLWELAESEKVKTAMFRFFRSIERKTGRTFAPRDFHRWSITETGAFWQAVADFTEVKWTHKPRAAFLAPPPHKMRGARWFYEGTLNFAENLLPPASDRVVLIAWAEGAPRKTLSAQELRQQVAQFQAALVDAGVGKGDRVAGVVANIPEAIIAMLATTALGAIWSSCSPDFGVGAIVDRFSQIEPKVVLFSRSYQYNGRVFKCEEMMRGCLAGLPSVKTAVVTTHLATEEGPLSGDFPCQVLSWESFIKPFSTCREPSFLPLPFDHPVYILFSSGTTGVPKCIVHGSGGTLLQHKKEHLIHSDIGPESRLFYYTTCGWMMWNWMVSALSTGASLVIYDGSPAFPDLTRLWKIVDDEKVTAFGTSPKFLASCMAASLKIQDGFTLQPLRTILSTGAPLLPEQFKWVYEQVKQDVHLASVSGGTDIISCFMIGNPLLPVYAGEIQGPGLGMAVEVWDEAKRNLKDERGELVCTRPFVSMPLGFWNDPDAKKYSAAYFDYFSSENNNGEEVWRHGDFVALTPHGGYIVYGRSDATLNPGGVRIGTAEIYRQVDQIPGVLDSVAIGQEWHGDTRIVLLVKIAPGHAFSAALADKIRHTIRASLSPRHVPAVILEVSDIPYTRSGKKMELAVTQILHGQAVLNRTAAVNPDCFAEYEVLRSVL